MCDGVACCRVECGAVSIIMLYHFKSRQHFAFLECFSDRLARSLTKLFSARDHNRGLLLCLDAVKPRVEIRRDLRCCGFAPIEVPSFASATHIPNHSLNRRNTGAKRFTLGMQRLAVLFHADGALIRRAFFSTAAMFAGKRSDACHSRSARTRTGRTSC